MITLTSFIQWLTKQSGTIQSPARTWCESKFANVVITGTPRVRVSPKEICVTYRYAWTDTYTPDAGLELVIEKLRAQQEWAVEDALEIALKVATARLDHLATVTELKARAA